MNDRRARVAIIGAGTAGLVALSEVRKVTDDFVVIENGPLGTTCARVGCMPSKALIQAAHDYHRRQAFRDRGIGGAEGLTVDIPAVLRHVRRIRDRFTQGMVRKTEALGDRLVRGRARFLEPGVLGVDGAVIRAQRIIVATGSRPVVPAPWRAWGDRVITSDTLFDRDDLPGSLAVIGMGVIGIELGQALSRLGVDVVGVDQMEQIAGLSDSAVNAYALQTLGAEFPLWLGAPAEIAESGQRLSLVAGKRRKEVDALLVAVGRAPRVEDLGLDALGVSLRDNGLPEYDAETLRVGSLDVFVAGDANDDRPILHEAWNDGLVAGYNAMQSDPHCFMQRTPLRITFSDPNIAIAGRSRAELQADPILTGTASFEHQGRAVIRGENQGLLHLYADGENGILRGAEMMAPDGEHLAHLLAWSIQQRLTVCDLVKMPYYHPTIEEGIQQAVRDIVRRLHRRPAPSEVIFCDATPADGLC